MTKRILAIILSVTMIVTFLPVFALAEGYAVTNGTPESAKETNHGYIVIDKTTAEEDETVTVTVNPAEGYQLDTLQYNDGTTDYDITKDATTGNYQFTMPGYAVTVTAEFEKVPVSGGKTLPYSFDFETDMTAEGWTTIDADGDEYDWRTDTDALWDEKLGIDEGHCAMSRSYVNNVGPRNADNWLFSPAITIPVSGATVSWYEQSQDASYPDFYEVYVSETAVAQAYNESTAPNGMKVLYAYHEAANPWTKISVELSAENYGGKTVYIAFRHQSEDCYILDIDNFAAEAKSVSHTYTVTFDANGGSVTPTSAETGTDGKLATLPTPTRSGSYSFDGWYTMKEGGTKVDTNTVFTATATIYAHWSRSFSFAHLPKTGVTNITVPAGDYYTGVAAKDAFILYWDENIKTDGNFILIDYVDTDINGYHSWTITIENGVPVATDGGFMEYYTTLDLINNEPFYASYDKWVNGTYSAIHTHAFTYTANNGKITATCVDGCDDGFDENPLTLTLTAPENLAYDGNAKAFTFADGESDAWEAAGLELPDIVYCIKQSGQSEYLPLFGTLKFAGNYMAQITVDGKTAQVEFTIDKATPYIKTTPAPNDIEYGETLADSTLFGGYVQVSSTDSTQVGGLFEWTEPDTVPGIDDSEVTLYDVTFTPADEQNFTTASCQVTVTVNHTHAPVLVNGQAATESAAGFMDYYECICGLYYEDAAGEIPIDDLAAWKAEGGAGYIAPIDPTETTVDLRIGDKEFIGVKGGETLEVASLDDLQDITVLVQNGVDVEGMSEDWSMSTKFLDSEGRGVLEVQVFEEGDDYVTFNLQSHYADCPGASVDDFQIMMITVKVEASAEKLLGDANDDGNVNMKDVLLMRKFLAGMSVTLNEQNSDVTGDGDVNMKDVLMLRKYLAGLITELGA